MAAGLGFKTFTTGEVLTAGDVNGYLMQGVLVFASAAARNAAITSPQEGQFAFTKDTNGLWYYDGAAWVASGATGDIEGVTAGVGITGGGTSGTVTITNDMATTITASGDIVIGTGSGTYDNLPIGTTNQVLTADTTVSPYKVKWSSPSADVSYTLLNSGNTSPGTSTSKTWTGLSGYNSYLIVIQGVSSTASIQPSFTYGFNANAASHNYFRQRIDIDAASLHMVYQTNASYVTGQSYVEVGFSANGSGSVSGRITLDAGKSSGVKPFRSMSGGSNSTSYGARTIYAEGTFDGAAITSFQFDDSSGNFDGGNIYIYGA
jgi:hypothetical protein